MGMSGSVGPDRADLERRLVELREEHRDLDQAIAALTHPGHFNQVRVQRLKKRKLAIRDHIALIENTLLPDIIA